MPSKEALDLLDLLEEDPNIARQIDWDVLAQKEPDLNISNIRSDYLEELGRRSAVGLRPITKERYEQRFAELFGPEKIDIQPSEAEKRREALKISAVADLAAVAEPATTAFPTRREQIREPTLRRGIPEEGAIGAPTPEGIPPTPEEIADIQKQLEQNRKTGNQKLEAFLSYIPRKFVKFGTEQYEALRLLGQLATQPEIEVDGQKIPTHQVVAQLPAAVGEHYLGYLKDPIEKVTDDPFMALLDAFIVKQVVTGMSKAAVSAARKIKGVPAMAGGRVARRLATPIKYKATLHRGVADREPLHAGGIGEGEYYSSSKQIAKSYAEDFSELPGKVSSKTIELKNPFYAETMDDVFKLVGEEGALYQRQGLSPTEIDLRLQKDITAKLLRQGHDGIVLRNSLDPRSGNFVKADEVVIFPKAPKPIGRPEIVYNPAAENIVSARRAKEAGGVLAATSEELTQAGLQMEKANLYTRYVGEPLYNKIKEVGKKIIPERMQRFFTERYGQPAEYAMAVEKNMTDMGLNIEKSIEWAKGAEKAFTADDKISMLKFITDPERIGIRMRTPMGTKWEPVAMQMQADMATLGSQAKSLGLIGEESFDFFFGRYLPKLHPEKRMVTIFPGKKIKFSARLKQRGEIKEIPIEELGKWEAKGWELFTDLGTGRAKIRQFVPFGTEQDPFALWAKGVSDLEHDIAIGKTIKFVADNPNWVSDVPKEGFVKLVKKGKALEDRFMRVSGIGNKYVHQEIAADLREMILTKSDWRKFFDQMTSLWKIGKTAYNPATHSRNIVSNAILADMGGLSPIRRFDVYLESAKQFVNKGKYFNEAKSGGLFGKEFQFEINQMFRDATSAKDPASFWSKMVRVYRQGPPTRVYQGEEQFFKMAKFIQNRQKGLSVADAVRDAHKWIFDYSTVSPFVALGRRTFFPFITFQAKALPRIFETAIKHPLRIGKYWAAYEAYNRHSKTRLGLNDEQYRELRQNTPDYIRKGGMWLLLPERDQNGNYQFINMTYFMPWGDIISGGSNEGGLFSGLPEPLQNILVPSHPIVRLPFELALNKSIFYDRDLWRADENPWIESAEYVAETLGPSIATQHLPRLHRRLIQKRPSFFGERQTTGATLAGLVGARPVSVSVERAAFFRTLEVEKKIKDLESRYFSTQRNQSITDDERAKKLTKIRGKIDKLVTEWKELSKGPARRYRSR